MTNDSASMQSPVNVRVYFFSVLREKVGRGVLEVSLPPEASGRDLLDHLSNAQPEIAPYRSVIRLAVNESYVREDVLLKDGDEAALITPVSGG